LSKSGSNHFSKRKSEVDVIILGVGTCGEDLALQLLGAGLSVVGIEANLVGGECPYWACLPSKMMIRAAHTLQEARRVPKLAGQAVVTPDWNPVAARIRAEATGGWEDSVAVARFESRGGHLVHGWGRLTGPRTVAVGDQSFTARRGIVIATGSQPAIPPIPGLSKVDYWTTHEVIEAEKLPESIVILGGGAVGCELGQVLARFGVKVKIVEREERLLPAEEPEASAALAAAFTAEGIGVYTGMAAKKVDADNGSIIVTLDKGVELSAERLLVATGRKVDLSNLGLESAGIQNRGKYLDVDERMRVADGIWGMGDVTGKGMFSYVALYQAAIIAAEILGGKHPSARYEALPRVTITDPEVGSVGITEAEARSKELDVVVVVKQLSATFRGWLDVANNGVLKLIADRRTGVLLGATAVGPRGGELLGLFSLAVHERITLESLKNMIYAFPTFYGGIGEAIGAYGRGLATVFEPDYEGFEIVDSTGIGE
jgi:pyruvate/2-oxoglutarate dehydrogenase complex dihydrolipoamide dehydrogenase (E3) component